MKQNNTPSPPSLQGGETFLNIGSFLDFWLQEDFLTPQSQEVFDVYYAGYKKSFSPYIHYHYQNQTREILALLNGFSTRGKSPRLLEVGCGCGTESLWLAYRGAQVLEIDIAPGKIQVCRERKQLMESWMGDSLSCEFQRLSLLDLKEKNSFDLIWMEQTFHHLEPRQEILNSLTRLLKPGGYLVISEINGWNPLMQIKLFLYRGWPNIYEYQDQTGKVHLVGNERILSGQTLKRELKNRGIYLHSLRYFRCLPNYPWPPSIISLEKRLPQWFNFIFSHLNYVGRKK